MKTTLVIILSLTISLSALGQKKFSKAKNPKAIIEKLNQASKKTNTIDSDFKQYKHMDILSSDIVSDGHFSYKANNKVRWEYTLPYKYIIIMNDNLMWINDGKKTKKYDTNSNKIFKEINDLMVGMLQGKILNSEQFNVSFYENNTHILAKLKPKSGNMKEFLSEMELYFDKKTYNATKIVMNEASGDFTKIEFLNRKINKELPNSIFLVR